MGQTATIIGATGVVGRALVEQLSCDTGIDSVIAITRRPIDYSSNKVINHVVSFDLLAQCSASFDSDILLSCLGTTLKQAGSIEQQRVVDVDYQYQAAKLALTNGVKHYLLVSSSGASLDSSSAYLKMKAELEAKVTELGFERISIIQPSLLLGERQDFRLAEKIGASLLPLLCRLPLLRKYRPITGKQVAVKMCQIALQPLASEGAAHKKQVNYYRLDELFS